MKKVKDDVAYVSGVHLKEGHHRLNAGLTYLGVDSCVCCFLFLQAGVYFCVSSLVCLGGRCVIICASFGRGLELKSKFCA